VTILPIPRSRRYISGLGWKVHLFKSRTEFGNNYRIKGYFHKKSPFAGAFLDLVSISLLNHQFSSCFLAISVDGVEINT
jgi:hypothetical protein